MYSGSLHASYPRHHNNTMATKTGSQFDQSIKPGQLIAEKYRVVEPLGSGNFAYVLRAQHEVMGRDVALKILKPEVVRASPDVSKRFLTEVRIVSRLKCPNTVTIFDFGETPSGLLYMVLEFVDGISLDQVLKTGRIDTERAVKIGVQVLKSLDEAHAMGVVHRDLKPGNIMLTKSRDIADFVKVLDFGVAKLMSEDDEALESTPGGARRSTQFIGTPIYMSPEQVLGRDISPESDFYGLGLILYEMLSGHSPIDSSLNVAAVAQQHIDYKPLPFAAMNSIPPPLREVIFKATARRPEDRYKSAREFARALKVDSTGDFQEHVERRKSGKRSPKPELKRPPSTVPSGPFSGQNYVDFPDEGGQEAGPKPSRKIPSGINPTIKRPQSSLEISGELQVDIGKVRREELARKRESRVEVERRLEKAIAMSGTDYLWLAAGVGGFFVSFFLFSAMTESSPFLRSLAGCAPFGVALMFTVFSAVRRVHGKLMERWLLPLARETALVTLGSLILVSLTSAEQAEIDIRAGREWFVEGIPALGLALKPIGYLVYGLLESWFGFVAAVLPW